MDIVIELILCPRENARLIAHTLIERSLAVAVDILPGALGLKGWGEQSSGEVTVMVYTIYDMLEEVISVVNDNYRVERQAAVATQVSELYTSYREKFLAAFENYDA